VTLAGRVVLRLARAGQADLKTPEVLVIHVAVEIEVGGLL